VILTVWKWVDEKTGMGGALDDFLNKPVPVRLSWVFSLGSAALFLFGMQAVTGTFLALYYAPTPDHAYDSLRFIETQVTFGRIIRGFHHWGATLMVITVGMHLVRVVLFGSYKKPREATWIIGVVLLFFVMAFGFTGYLLPWDQKAYWATVVGTEVAGSAPLVGGLVLRVMRGGAEVGALTLTRFYAAHVLVLPAITIALIGAHLMMIRKWGISGHWKLGSREPEETEPFYPTQVFKDTVGMVVVLLVLLTLTSVFGVHMEAPADVTDTTYQPKPEWYFLPLYQFLKYLPGPWEVVGTLVGPVVSFLVLVALPFWDRKEERSPWRRPLVTGSAAVLASMLLVLTYLGYTAPVPGGGAVGPPEPASHVELAPELTAGRDVYKENSCQSCHQIHGAGTAAGPDLSRIGSQRSPGWLRVQIVDPKRNDPKSTMPPFPQLSKKELDSLVTYLSSLKK
jgi:ubiquinol-cytochrome c reductase cytochrome b subunit